MSQPFMPSDPFLTPMAPAAADPFVTSDPGHNLDTSESIRQLNSFLRGEISAAETYRIALEKLSASDRTAMGNETGLLQSIQDEHVRAVAALRDRIRELGGEPSDSSGAWGAWAKMTTSLSSLFGDAGALKSLKEGEEHGLKDYQEGLDDIDVTSAQLVQNQLIPAQQRHIALLDQLLDARSTT